jgi:hypothetical protein
VRQLYQAWQVNEASQEAALQHAQFTEEVRQWRQSDQAHETSEAAASHCTQVHRSHAERYPPTSNHNNL